MSLWSLDDLSNNTKHTCHLSWVILVCAVQLPFCHFFSLTIAVDALHREESQREREYREDPTIDFQIDISQVLTTIIKVWSMERNPSISFPDVVVQEKQQKQI
jgi:hypothetical protein